jgi:uncharacterized protein (TIGR02145 family)
MAIPSKQIGGSVNYNLLWQISKQLERLIEVRSNVSTITTTTTLNPNVTIGTQIWTNKNLDVTTYRDGTPIPEVTDPTAWKNLKTGAWCYYDNDPSNGSIYGKLYNWYAVAGIYDVASFNDPLLRKQLAPLDYHVPSDTEWTTLTTFLGGEEIAGGAMKEIGTTHWLSPNEGATNSSGFTALPGGMLYSANTYPYTGINYNGIFWTSTEEYGTLGYNRMLFKSSISVSRSVYSKEDGFSVRVIKD